MSTGSDHQAQKTDRLQSIVKIGDATAVILSLHGHFRDHVQFWHEQVYKACTWSIFAAYALIAYHLKEQTSPTAWAITLVLVLMIGVLSAGYIRYCENAHYGNWTQIANCELALQLHEPDVYFKGFSFFDKKPNRGTRTDNTGSGPGIPLNRVTKIVGMHADDITLIRWAHGIAILLAVIVLLVLKGKA